MAFTELIAATTAADDATLSVTGNTTITADYLRGDEEITVLVANVAGDGYKELWSKGKRIYLTADNNTDLIIGPADYKFIKNKTSNSVSVGYQS